jgi:hypothetical protein
LHLAIAANGLPPVELNYGRKGHLNEHPFAELQRDVQLRPGEETIDIGQWLPATYEIAVHAYTSDQELVGCGARVAVCRGEDVLTVTCPTYGSGSWWRVMTVDTIGGTTTIHNELSPTLSLVAS